MNEQDKSQKLLLRIPAAARLLDISRSKAYAMVQAGQLPSVRLGASLRVRVTDLDRYVNELQAGAA
jgi:excisionase family DNA binding protein